MMTNRGLSSMAFAGVMLASTAQAAPESELLEMINTYRASPQVCEGARMNPLPPLAPDAILASLQINHHRQLRQAMQAAGYRAARAEALTVSGSADASQVMRFVAQNSCRVLLNRQYSAAGISRKGEDWHIVLAQPLLAADLGDWQQAGQQVLKLVNAARSGERRCGNKHYGPVRPLRWNERLGTAALQHSRDMAKHNYIAHEGRDGSTVGIRAQANGYRWRGIGENVAAGQGSAAQAVAGWLSSPGHCANIMNGDFIEMGAAYAVNPDTDAGIYWTQVFGAPR